MLDSDGVEPPMAEPKNTQRIESETDHHLTGSKLYLVLGGLGLAIYLFALDIAVISTVRSVLATMFRVCWWG